MSRKAHLLTRPSLPQLRRLLDHEQRALLDAARAVAEARGTTLWLVGGAVRDLALGRPPHDLDLAIASDTRRFATALLARLRESASPTPANAPTAAASAATRTPHAEVEHEARFGTTSIRLGGEGADSGDGGSRLDLARLRREEYAAPGALPTVRFTRDLEADLARRDFTVNAMALRLTGGPRAARGDRAAFVDPWHGLDDLAARRLRVLHARSFLDDPTRLWRGARTAALGGLAPDEETARLIAEGVRGLDAVSGERIAAELRFTAARGHAGRTLALAEEWGVLRGTHPALRLAPATARAVRRRAGALPFEVLLALLLAPLGETPDGRRGILGRLAVSKSAATTVEQTARLLEAARDAPRAARTKREEHAAPETLARLAGASEAARTAARWLDPERQPAVLRDLARWERTRSPLDAAALTRLGVPRGPALGRTLDGLRRARYLGTLSTAADARRAVPRMVEANA